MVLRTCDSAEFMRRTSGKKVVGWGAGQMAAIWDLAFVDSAIGTRFDYLVDMDVSKQGQSICLNGKKLIISTVNKLLNDAEIDVVVINTLYVEEMLETLKDATVADRIEVYVSWFICENDGLNNFYAKAHVPKHVTESALIPKKIHYCWFGRGVMSDLNKHCIESWRKYCPDYEIVEWNEDNCDMKNNLQMQEAYENRAWGYTADFIRFQILYEHGGIYMDSDVEILKNIDELLFNEAFGSYRSWMPVFLSGSPFGCRPKFELFKIIHENNRKMFADYLDGKYDRLPAPCLDTAVLRERGWQPNWQFHTFEGMSFYPQEYIFAPRKFSDRLAASPNMLAIHHTEFSWGSPERKATWKKAKEWYKTFEKSEDTLRHV